MFSTVISTAVVMHMIKVHGPHVFYDHYDAILMILLYISVILTVADSHKCGRYNAGQRHEILNEEDIVCIRISGDASQLFFFHARPHPDGYNMDTVLPGPQSLLHGLSPDIGFSIRQNNQHVR